MERVKFLPFATFLKIVIGENSNSELYNVILQLFYLQGACFSNSQFKCKRWISLMGNKLEKMGRLNAILGSCDAILLPFEEKKTWHHWILRRNRILQAFQKFYSKKGKYNRNVKIYSASKNIYVGKLADQSCEIWLKSSVN